MRCGCLRRETAGRCRGAAGRGRVGRLTTRLRIVPRHHRSSRPREPTLEAGSDALSAGKFETEFREDDSGAVAVSRTAHEPNGPGAMAGRPERSGRQRPVSIRDRPVVAGRSPWRRYRSPVTGLAGSWRSTLPPIITDCTPRRCLMGVFAVVSSWPLFTVAAGAALRRRREGGPNPAAAVPRSECRRAWRGSRPGLTGR